MGKYLLCAPYMSTVCLGVNALLLGGNSQQQKTHLPSIASGKTTATLAYVETDFLTNQSAPNTQTSVVKQADGFVLNGSKSFVFSRVRWGKSSS